MRKIFLICALLGAIVLYALLSSPEGQIEIPENATTPNEITAVASGDSLNETETESPNPNEKTSFTSTKKKVDLTLIQSSLVNLPDEAVTDCFALKNGLNGGGDLLATLIENFTISSRLRLGVYTEEYLQKLALLIDTETTRRALGEFLSTKVCNLAPSLDIIAGYITDSTNNKTNTGLAIVNNSEIFIYPNVELISSRRTEADTLPCKATIEQNGSFIRWSCFKGFKTENSQITGENFKEYLFDLTGSAPKIWEGTKPTSAEIAEASEFLNEENQSEQNPESENKEDSTKQAEQTQTPPADPIAVRSSREQIKFLSCGGLGLFKNQAWYKDLENSSQALGLNLGDINQACYSSNGQILIMITKAVNGKFGDIYRFDLPSKKIERAHIAAGEFRDNLAPIDRFGKRVDNEIELSAATTIDNCRIPMAFRYNFINNVLSLTSAPKCE